MVFNFDVRAIWVGLFEPLGFPDFSWKIIIMQNPAF